MPSDRIHSMINIVSKNSSLIRKHSQNNWLYIRDIIYHNDDHLDLYVAHRLCTKLIHLQICMHDLNREFKIYSSKILYRSFIEHYVKCQYLMFNPEGIENLGKKYLTFGEVEEFISKYKSQKVYDNLFSETHANIWEMVQVQFPSMKNYSKAEAEKIYTIFNFKHMVKHLGLFFKDKAENLNQFENLLFHYWECSSFVHAGPSVEYLLYDSFNELSELELHDFEKLISMPYFYTYETMKLIFGKSYSFNQKGFEFFIYIDKLLVELYKYFI